MAGAFPPNTIASLTAPPRQRGGGEDRVDQEAQYGQLTYSGHKAERGHFRDTTKATAENYKVEHHPRGTPITGSLPPQSPRHMPSMMRCHHSHDPPRKPRIREPA